MDNKITDKMILVRTIKFSFRASLLILFLDVSVLYMLYFTFGRFFISLDLTLLIEAGLLFIWTGISGSFGLSFSVQSLRTTFFESGDQVNFDGDTKRDGRAIKSNKSKLDAAKIKNVTITAWTYSVIAVFLFIYTIILGSF